MSKFLDRMSDFLGRYIILAYVMAILLAFSFSGIKPSVPLPIEPKLEPLVAHAGGAIYGMKYTNSLEAINKSYQNGFRLIELDFEWTADGYPVSIHDWNAMAKRLLLKGEKQYDLEEFLTSETLEDFTLMDIEIISKWLKRHKDAFIITDVKNNNAQLMTFIKEEHPEMVKQIVPQMYKFEQYDIIKVLGFEHIIFTLYDTDANDEEILEFLKTHQVFAVTMPEERGRSTLPGELKKMGIKTYVHPVNSLGIYEELNENGVYGIYTDYLEVSHWPYSDPTETDSAEVNQNTSY